MQLERVVITGVGAVSCLGLGAERLCQELAAGRSGISRQEEFARVRGLRCLIGGAAPEVECRELPRQRRRTMTRMSLFAAAACQEALAQAGVRPELRASGRLGLALAATTGSPATYQEFFEDYLRDHSIERTKSTLFFKIMAHSVAANTAQALDVRGRVLSPAAACATAGQAIGLGYEAILLGRQELMLCGGADELHPLTVASFDIMNAASTQYNERPDLTPRPFDARRDGTVCSEGCGVLLLESLRSARRRGAVVLAEVLGFSTGTDVSNISNPDARSIENCMLEALRTAGLEPSAIDYVSAHATATEHGDIAEAQAIAGLFGAATPVSCLKGQLGHSLAASGALESIAVLRMLREGRVLPTHNLDELDPRCAGIMHVREPLERPLRLALKNNFGLGGVNTSIVFGRCE